MKNWKFWKERARKGFVPEHIEKITEWEEKYKQQQKQIEILKGIIIEKRLQNFCYCNGCIEKNGGIIEYQKKLRIKLQSALEIEIEKKEII